MNARLKEEGTEAVNTCLSHWHSFGCLLLHLLVAPPLLQYGTSHHTLLPMTRAGAASLKRGLRLRRVPAQSAERLCRKSIVDNNLVALKELPYQCSQKEHPDKESAGTNCSSPTLFVYSYTFAKSSGQFINSVHR